MSSKAKAKALADDFDDDEVASMLGLETPNPSDPEQWARDNNGDLDWAYTARTVRKWSHDALLTHLYEKSFSIPPREYNPSAPFVWVELASGDKVTLPHGYRLPLMFVAKYRWEIIHSKISNERLWKQERSNVFHLSRLCENLFRRAQAKASRGGMEKGWRCVMFDRLLARFYKHWWRNDPEGGKGFLTTHGPKEYDRDVLKHDWKRWCLRGLNGVKMTEDEVTNGITSEQFRKSLKKGDDGLWTIDDEPLPHITDAEPPDDSYSSELTEYSMDETDASFSEDDVEIGPIVEYVDDEGNVQGKRPRIPTTDDDEMERNNKRSRMQDVFNDNASDEWPRTHGPLFPIFPLSRTLAAMARNPIWAHTNQTTDSVIESTSQIPTESTPFSSVPDASSPAFIGSMGPPASAPPYHTLPKDTMVNPSLRDVSFQGEASATAGSDGTSAQPSSGYPPMPPNPTATSSWPLPSNEDPTPGTSALLPSSHSAIPPGSSFASTSASASISASARPSRAASMKSRQNAVAVSGNMGSTSSKKSILLPPPRTFGPSPMRRMIKTKVQVPIQQARPSPAGSNSSISSLTSTPRGGTPQSNAINGDRSMGGGMGVRVGTAAGVQAHQTALHTKALELLVNLLDVKHVLENNFTAAAAAAATAAATVSNANAQAARMQQLPPTTTATTTGPSNTELGPSTNGNASSSPDATLDPEGAKEEKAVLESKFIDFEGRFAAMKEELKGIVERVQVLEGLTTSTSTGRETEVSSQPRVTVGDDEGDREETARMALGVEASNAVGGLPLPPTNGADVAITVGGGDGMEISPETMEKDQGPKAKEDSNLAVDGRAERETGDVAGAGTVESGEVPVEKPTEMNTGVEEEGKGEKDVEGDTDVVMSNEADNVEAEQPGTAQEPAGEALAQRKQPMQDKAHPKTVEEPAKENDTPQSQSQAGQLENSSPLQLEIQSTTEPSRTTPATATQSPQAELHGLDTHVHPHPHTTSEPDTDITMANASTASTSSSTLLNEVVMDPRTQDMSSNLTLLVDSLVSAKMLSVMEGMVKTRVKDKEDAEKNKTEQEGCLPSSSGGGADAERERERDVNVNGPLHPLIADTLSLSRSFESNPIASLIDEMRAMKSEFRAREQREKEQMQAMRELHSAEVDVLRKRLSYLETQNRQQQHVSPVPVDQVSNPLGGAGDSNGRYHHSSSTVVSHAESSYQGQHGSPLVGSQSRHSGSQYSNSNVNGHGYGYEHARASPVEAESLVKEPEPPVRFHTDRSFRFKKPIERDDDVPLPIKSQRKQHFINRPPQYPS